MNIKETIRAEIERRKNNAETIRERSAYIGLLAFLDSLPEQPASEDERIRKELIQYHTDGMKDSPWFTQTLRHQDVVAWLEKQKEPHYSPLCNTIKDKIREYIANHFIADKVVKTEMKSIVKAMEEGVRLGKEEQKPAEPSGEGISREDILNNIYQNDWITLSDFLYLTKQKEQKPLTVEDVVEQSKRFGREVEVLHKDEQKPVEYLNKDKVYAIMKKLHDLAFSQLIPINSDEYKKIGEITSDVSSLLDYPIEQKVQKPAEWSEEDEEMLDIVLTMVDCSTVVPHSGGQLHPSESYKKDISNWLKSLRPSWKPSEEHPVEWKDEYREEDLRTRFAFYTYKNEEDDSVLYLSNVFVEEASRNAGFGTKILEAAEKVAETIGAITIRLKVKQDSPANAWYRKRGYGYIAFEGEYDWLEKNLEYLKPKRNKQERVEGLEEEIKSYFNGWCNDDEYGQAVMPDCCCAGVDDCKDIARHFAEWGAEHLKK